MPEGDTLFRIAAALRPALLGASLTRVEFSRLRGVDRLRWHLYAPGERWRRPRHLARVVLGTQDRVAVCFAAPVVEVGRIGDRRLDHLGPDLCAVDVDIDAVVGRVAHVADPRTEIADVLLDQRLAAGIGNVYKSEALFACRIDPFAPLAEVLAGDRRRLYETAAGQLAMNLGSGVRQTVPGGLAVYGGRTGVRGVRRRWRCARRRTRSAGASSPRTPRGG